MTYYVEANAFDKIKVIDDILQQAGEMSLERLKTLYRFSHQVSDIHDVDAVNTFLKWKDHPVLDSILLLVSELDEDSQYEILHRAEDLINECNLQLRRNR